MDQIKFVIRSVMTFLLRNNFLTNKPTKKNDDRVYTTDDYDEMFSIPKKVLSGMCIRMTHDITETRAKLWNVIYWLEVTNLCLAMPAEFMSMLMGALEADSFRDCVKVFRMIPCFGAAVLSMFKSLKIKSNRTSFEKLHYELREIWPTGRVTEEEHRIISAVSNQFNFIAKGYYWCNNALLMSFLAPSIFFCLCRYLGYDAPMVLSFEFWLPYDPFKPVVLEITLMLQTWAAIVVIWWNIAWDMLFCMYLGHITMQFDLVSRRVRRLICVPIDQQIAVVYPLAKISKELAENKDILGLKSPYKDYDFEIKQQRELIDIIKRHHTLIRLTENVESLFSFALLINFLNSSMVICFCGFCSLIIEKWNEIAYKSFFVTTLSQIWLLCWYGQKLLDSSLGLSRALYECGWYNSCKKVKSAILFMLLRAQQGVRVTTYGFSTMSLSTYTAIIRTSWSYFTLILNVYTRSSGK